MKAIHSLFNKKDPNQLVLKKESSGEWVVRKGTSVLYIGPKDKCEIYMSQVEVV